MVPRAPLLRVYNRTENPFTPHQLVQVRLPAPALGSRPVQVLLTCRAPPLASPPRDRNWTLELGAIPRDYLNLSETPLDSWRRCEPSDNAIIDDPADVNVHYQLSLSRSL